MFTVSGHCVLIPSQTYGSLAVVDQRRVSLSGAEPQAVFTGAVNVVSYYLAAKQVCWNTNTGGEVYVMAYCLMLYTAASQAFGVIYSVVERLPFIEMSTMTDLLSSRWFNNR